MSEFAEMEVELYGTSVVTSFILLLIINRLLRVGLKVSILFTSVVILLFLGICICLEVYTKWLPDGLV